MHINLLAVAALFVLCLALGACDSESTPTKSEDIEHSLTAVPHVEPTSPPAQASGSVSLSSGDAATALSLDVVVSGTLSAEPAAKLSANNAYRAELQAGFEAAGISNASLWAREVDECRPYPEDDPDLTKLRTGLAEHNADPGVVDAIIALLELP